MDILYKLDAIEQIKTLKARYWRYIDTRQWDKFPSVFDPNITFEFPEFDEGIPAADFFVWIQDFLAGSISIHRGYAPEIEILDEDHATGIWQFEDRIFWEKSNPGKDGMLTLQGDGHYHDRYVRIDGAWKIASQQVTRHQLNIQTGTISLAKDQRR